MFSLNRVLIILFCCLLVLVVVSAIKASEPLSDFSPLVAKELKGKWTGAWRCTGPPMSDGIGSSGGFELEIISIKGESVRGRGIWHNIVSGSAPFIFEGKIEGKELVWQRDKDRWIKLILVQLPKKKLSGEYSTIGAGNLYYGDISLSKKEIEIASSDDFSFLIGEWQEVTT